MPSAAEASLVSESCLFSLATLEFACLPDTLGFALTECEHSGVWRWAVISPEGSILDDGREPTQARAQSTAEAVLRVVAA
jgi:hypothetical protein